MDELEDMLEIAPLFDIDLPAKAKYYNQKTKLAIDKYRAKNPELFSDCLKRYRAKNKDSYNETQLANYHLNKANPEWIANRNNKIKQYNQKKREQKILAGWLPAKRGPKTTIDINL